MNYLSIIFSLIAIAAGMALAYADKIMNATQPRKARSEVRSDTRRITKK